MEVPCVRTHMSRVWLFEHEVIKVPLPVRFAFVDHTTVEQRLAACRAEILHNAPWAPGVYLGVTRVEGEPPVPARDGEPAVRMRRLDDADCLVSRLERLEVGDIRRVGRHIAGVHAQLPPHELAAHPASVTRRILDNVRELTPFLGAEEVEGWTARARGLLECVREELASRGGLGRQLHGDLRCEHVYLTDDGIRILDGVAFAPELAQGDPAEDVAFLAMDLAVEGRPDLAVELWKAALDEPPSRPLADLYAGHRALIRAKVGFLQGSPERARRFLQHARVRWRSPSHRPALIGISGLPGVGKSTLAGILERFFDFATVRTDVVRKLAGPVDYSDAGRTRIYEQTLDEARRALERGDRVVVDASFGTRQWRRMLMRLGRETGVPARLIVAHAPEAVARARIAARRGGPSDADERVYAELAARWEPLDSPVSFLAVAVDTGDTVDAAYHQVREALEGWELTNPREPGGVNGGARRRPLRSMR